MYLCKPPQVSPGRSRAAGCVCYLSEVRKENNSKEGKFAMVVFGLFFFEFSYFQQVPYIHSPRLLSRLILFTFFLFVDVFIPLYFLYFLHDFYIILFSSFHLAFFSFALRRRLPLLLWIFFLICYRI